MFAGLGANAQAQTDPAASYPSRTIKIVVGFAAGGGNDIIARIVGQKLQESLGQSVIIENKVGAGGRLAADAVMAAPPDGYTLLVGASGAMSIIPAISVKPPYDTLKDFAPISMIASFPLILAIYPSHPAKNVQELVAWMKANPDKSNYATSSPGLHAGDRAVQAQDRRAGDGDPLQEQQRIARQRHRPAIPAHHRRSAADHAAGQGRPGARARRHLRTSASPTSRTCRPWRRPASPASMSGCGAACSSPAATPPAIVQEARSRVPQDDADGGREGEVQGDGDAHGRR